MPSINSLYHYRTDIIVLLWEKALREQNCQFFVAKGNVQKTLFGHNAQNATRQQKPAGLVLNVDGSLYQCPLNNRTLSIAQAIDRDAVSSGVESTMSALDAAVAQCRAWQTLALADDDHYDLLTQHTIVMPYHNGPNHWNFGCLDIDWEKDKITKAVFTVYEPLHATLQLNSLKKRLASSLSIDEQYIDVIPQCTMQQQDGASCGAISAENGVHYITANKKGWDKQRKTIYKKGAHALREKHLTTIKDKNFTHEQQANQFYHDSARIFQLEPYEHDIVETLEKCLGEHVDLRSNFTAYVQLFLNIYKEGNHEGYKKSSIIQSTLSTWFRKNIEILKAYTIPKAPDLNLFNIFFKNDGDLSWKDGILSDAVDILNKWDEAYGKRSDNKQVKQIKEEFLSIVKAMDNNRLFEHKDQSKKQKNFEKSSFSNKLINFETLTLDVSKYDYPEINRELFDHVDDLKNEEKDALVKIFENKNNFFKDTNKEIVPIKYYSNSLQKNRKQTESDIALDFQVAQRFQQLLNDKNQNEEELDHEQEPTLKKG